MPLGTPKDASMPGMPLVELLLQLRSALQAQADALDVDDFERLARAGAERDRLVASLDQYQPVDFRPEDRAVLEQVAALDQRLVASARDSLARADLDRRAVFRGQGALQQYRRRGQSLIGALHQLDAAR
jgi:hypothetical protein